MRYPRSSATAERSSVRQLGLAMILVTNDDGVDSPGLSALARALKAVEEVCIIAPNRNWTAAGHTKTLDRPLRVTEITLPGTRLAAFSSDGSPSDCVALGFLGLSPTRPRLVVSGINTGPNMGSDITYSGTVSAAMEGVVSGVPAIAVSLADYFEWDFHYAAQFAARLARRVLREGLASDILLNVNVPRGQRKDVKGVQITRLGRREYNDELIRRKDPYGRDYFWIGGSPPGGAGEPGTDLHAVAAGYVSVTPVQLDLTNHSLIEDIAAWNLSV